MNKKNTDPHYLKPIKKQWWEPRNKQQAKEAEEITHSHLTRPMNAETNCYFLSEQEGSITEGMSNKEFYASRRGKQSRFDAG